MATKTLPRDVKVGDTPRQTTRWVERLISLPDRLPGAAILWLFVLFAVLVILAHAPLSWLIWRLAIAAGAAAIAYIVRQLRQVSRLHRMAYD